MRRLVTKNEKLIIETEEWMKMIYPVWNMEENKINKMKISTKRKSQMKIVSTIISKKFLIKFKFKVH